MKRMALATILAFTTTVMAPAFAAAAPAAQAPAAGAISIPVTGTGTGGTFTGVFQLQKFVAQAGSVVATGLLTGTLTDAAGVVTSIVQTVSMPVSVAQATCDILHLDLGPLHLNLLGLEIDLSRIVLDITAQSGAGNLLGNLLCSVAGLLDNPGGLARLLNSILGILG